ncbi:MAG: hypothetical protein N2653_09585 [Burkholderiales bacterium]|nr:hypothetical protein [Burkholderiales bacterium]
MRHVVAESTLVDREASSGERLRIREAPPRKAKARAMRKRRGGRRVPRPERPARGGKSAKRGHRGRMRPPLPHEQPRAIDARRRHGSDATRRPQLRSSAPQGGRAVRPPHSALGAIDAGEVVRDAGAAPVALAGTARFSERRLERRRRGCAIALAVGRDPCAHVSGPGGRIGGVRRGRKHRRAQADVKRAPQAEGALDARDQARRRQEDSHVAARFSSSAPS